MAQPLGRSTYASIDGSSLTGTPYLSAGGQNILSILVIYILAQNNAAHYVFLSILGAGGVGCNLLIFEFVATTTVHMLSSHLFEGQPKFANRAVYVTRYYLWVLGQG